jgi:hypothetical protein
MVNTGKASNACAICKQRRIRVRTTNQTRSTPVSTSWKLADRGSSATLPSLHARNASNLGGHVQGRKRKTKSSSKTRLPPSGGTRPDVVHPRTRVGAQLLNHVHRLTAWYGLSHPRRQIVVQHFSCNSTSSWGVAIQLRDRVEGIMNIYPR